MGDEIVKNNRVSGVRISVGIWTLKRFGCDCGGGEGIVRKWRGNLDLRGRDLPRLQWLCFFISSVITGEMAHPRGRFGRRPTYTLDLWTHTSSCSFAHSDDHLDDDLCEFSIPLDAHLIVPFIYYILLEPLDLFVYSLPWQMTRTAI